MRIPSNRLHHTMVYRLNETLGRIERIQSEMATGKRILRPSDDPPGTMRVLAMRSRLEETDQYKRNISDGLRWTGLTEAVLTEITDMLVELKEIAVRAADDTYGGRDALAGSVDELLGALLDQSRSRIDDRYLFSGFDTLAAPFSESCQVEQEELTVGAIGTEVDLEHARVVDGSVVVTDLSGGTTYVEDVDYSIDYATGRLSTLGGGALAEGTQILVGYETQGTSSVTTAGTIQGAIVRQVDADRTETVNVLGTDVFQGEVDLFELAIDLKNALWKDDGEAVRSLLPTISEAIDQTTALLGVVGSRANGLESQHAKLESDEIALAAFICEIEGADIVSAVVHLQAEQLAYETALAATARLMEISLVRYM
jgi:flagellar hook-associated protein 3